MLGIRVPALKAGSGWRVFIIIAIAIADEILQQLEKMQYLQFDGMLSLKYGLRKIRGTTRC